MQYDKYTLLTVKAGTAPTPSPEVVDSQAAGHESVQEPVVQKPVVQEPVVQEPAAQEDHAAAVSEAPQAEEPRIIGREEKIEYRDQDGNLLNEEQVQALEGKVEFQTKYETKTRVVDEDGNEISAPKEPVAPVAPPHPDVEGVDKETVKGGEALPDAAEKVVPQDVAASLDGEKEAESNQPKPASEGREATVHEEL